MLAPCMTGFWHKIMVKTRTKLLTPNQEQLAPKTFSLQLCVRRSTDVPLHHMQNACQNSIHMFTSFSYMHTLFTYPHFITHTHPVLAVTSFPCPQIVHAFTPRSHVHSTFTCPQPVPRSTICSHIHDLFTSPCFTSLNPVHIHSLFTHSNPIHVHILFIHEHPYTCPYFMTHPHHVNKSSIPFTRLHHVNT